MNSVQLGRLKRLADWLHDTDRKFLFELLVPATDGPARLRRRRHRPLRRRAPPRADAAGDRRTSRTSASRSTSGRSRASTSARTPRCWPSRPAPARVARASSACSSAAAPRPRRSSTGSSQAAPVEGFIGFAIGRSIWWDALKAFLAGDALPRSRGVPDRRQLPALREGLRGSGSSSRAGTVRPACAMSAPGQGRGLAWPRLDITW